MSKVWLKSPTLIEKNKNGARGDSGIALKSRICICMYVYGSTKWHEPLFVINI